MKIDTDGLDVAVQALNNLNELNDTDAVDVALGVENVDEVRSWFIRSAGDPVTGIIAYSGFTLGLALGSGNLIVQTIEGTDEELAEFDREMDEKGYAIIGEGWVPTEEVEEAQSEDIDDSPHNTTQD